MPPQDPFNSETFSVDLPEDMLKANPELRELMDLLKDLETSFNLQPPTKAITTAPTEIPVVPETLEVLAQTTEEQTETTETPPTDIALSPCLADLQPEVFASDPTEQQTEEKNIYHRIRLMKQLIGFSLLSLCIAMTYLFFNFDALSRDPNWHSAMAQVCTFLSCDAPLPEDISQIKSSTLILHPDVKHKNKLLLDAIIYNRATFTQPFPDIELLLSDEHQLPVAHYRFHPADYRQGQLLNISAMPSQQPIHITLSIPNPNISILNYELKFYSSLQSGIKRYHTSHVPSRN